MTFSRGPSQEPFRADDIHRACPPKGHSALSRIECTYEWLSDLHYSIGTVATNLRLSGVFDRFILTPNRMGEMPRLIYLHLYSYRASETRFWYVKCHCTCPLMTPIQTLPPYHTAGFITRSTKLIFIGPLTSPKQGERILWFGAPIAVALFCDESRHLVPLNKLHR